MTVVGEVTVIEMEAETCFGDFCMDVRSRRCGFVPAGYINELVLPFTAAGCEKKVGSVEGSGG